MKKLVYINNHHCANGACLLLSMQFARKQIVAFNTRNSKVTMMSLVGTGEYCQTEHRYSVDGFLKSIKHIDFRDAKLLQGGDREKSREIFTEKDEPCYHDFLDNAVPIKEYYEFFERKLTSPREQYQNWAGIKSPSMRDFILDSDVMIRFLPKYWGYGLTRELGQERNIVYATKPTRELVHRYLDFCWDKEFVVPRTHIDLNVYLMHNYPESKERLFDQLDFWVNNQRNLRSYLILK